MSGPFKMKGFSAHAGVSPAQSRKDENDPLLQNIKDTSQKGDEAVRPKPKSIKIGPAQSPGARKKDKS